MLQKGQIVFVRRTISTFSKAVCRYYLPKCYYVCTFKYFYYFLSYYNVQTRAQLQQQQRSTQLRKFPKGQKRLLRKMVLFLFCCRALQNSGINIKATLLKANYQKASGPLQILGRKASKIGKLEGTNIEPLNFLLLRKG